MLTGIRQSHWSKKWKKVEQSKNCFVDTLACASYCKFGNFRENFIFANSIKRHICHDKNLRLWNDLPTSVKNKELNSLFHKVLFSQNKAYLQ